MLAEFLDKLLQETKVDLHIIEDRTYSSRALHLVAPPVPSAIELATLSGLVDFAQEVDDKDEGGSENRFLVVEDYNRVSLQAVEHDAFGRRAVLAVAKCPPRCAFPFGKYLTPEEFIIALQMNFLLIDGEDLTYVLDIASGLSAELVTTSEDDGLAQKAAVRQGIALKKQVTIKRLVNLFPYRTFDDVGQPASKFLFRLRSQDPSQPPECALFLADGEAWKREAMQFIKTYLETKLGDDYVVVA